MIPTRSLGGVLRVVLAVVMAGTGLAKLIGGAPAGALLLSAPYYDMIAWFELLTAMVLLTRHAVLVSIAIVLISVIGVALAVFIPERSCGCLGNWAHLSRSGHLVLACATGTLAGLVLTLDGQRRRGIPGVSTGDLI